MEEQAKLDDHEDRVADVTSCLLELGVGEEKVAMLSAAGSSKPLKNNKVLMNVWRNISECESDSMYLIECCDWKVTMQHYLSGGMRIKESMSDMSVRLKHLQF